MKQKTIKGSFSLFGKGLHTGLNLTVTFNPAPENTGYKIKRIDLEGEPVIDAIAENVIDTQRGTVLAKGDARVSTVEHGLAAGDHAAAAHHGAGAAQAGIDRVGDVLGLGRLVVLEESPQPPEEDDQGGEHYGDHREIDLIEEREPFSCGCIR